jgi:iron complex outermembrane receptor protein
LALAGADRSLTVDAGLSGTPENAYFVNNVDQGDLGSSPIVNQPYTITVMPAEQITNTQVKSLRDAIMFLPFVSFTEQQGSEILRPSTRAFRECIAQNTAWTVWPSRSQARAPWSRMRNCKSKMASELPCSGPANPSGMFDFILKRPTEERTANLYLEQDGSSIGTVYGDAGGRLGPHKIFGYRSNLLFGDGTAIVEQSRLRRRLGEFAFDLRPTEHTTVNAHYSVYDIVQRGYPGWFSYGQDPTDTTSTAQRPKRTPLLPFAPDPTRLGFGQAYAGVNLTT